VIRERIGAGGSVYRISDASIHREDRTLPQRDAIDGRQPKQKATQAAQSGDPRASKLRAAGEATSGANAGRFDAARCFPSVDRGQS
jgi:hypothetical protein